MELENVIAGRPLPQIVVHALADAIAVLRVADQANMPVMLVSAPGAAGFAGPAWFRDMAAAAHTEVPRARFTAVLDCADAPGNALAAIREGVPAIHVDLPDDSLHKITEIAAQAGVEIVSINYSTAFDMLANHPGNNPEIACREWLNLWT